MSAIATRSSSPTLCPSVSLTDLKWSRSKSSKRAARAVPLDELELPVELLLEPAPVGESGERIVIGHPAQLLLVPAALGDVLHLHEHVRLSPRASFTSEAATCAQRCSPSERSSRFSVVDRLDVVGRSRRSISARISSPSSGVEEAEQAERSTPPRCRSRGGRRARRWRARPSPSTEASTIPIGASSNERRKSSSVSRSRSSTRFDSVMSTTTPSVPAAPAVVGRRAAPRTP